MKKWKKLSTEVINKNPWTSFLHDKFRLPNGKEGDYYYLHSNGAVIIFAIRSDGKIILTRQYRYLFDQISLEFPSGGIKEGQTPEDAAVDELAEEGGVKAAQSKYIRKLSPANGVYDEYLHIFVAWDLEDAYAKPDETEEFEMVYMTPGEVDEVIASGEMWDNFCIGPWAVARPYIMEIIDQMKKKG